MDKLYYDAFRCIFYYCDMQTLVYLLNCNNKKIYYFLIKYIKEKKIYRDIIRYDLSRLCLFKKTFTVCQSEHYLHECITIRHIFSQGCSLEVFKYLLRPGINLFNINWRVAAGGNVLNLQYLSDQNISCDTLSLMFAIRSTNYECIHWLVEKGVPLNVIITCEAALAGNLKNLIWLVKKGAPLVNDIIYNDSYDVMGCAAQYGSIKNMEWLKKEKCPLTTRTFQEAAKGYINNSTNLLISVDVKIFQWLKDNNCPWDRKTFSAAAQNGNLENMKWLKFNNCPWDEETFADAAGNGNLENMKWLKDYGCPWDEDTFYSAGYYGNLNNMKWLKKYGCPYDEYTWISVIHSDLNCEKIIENCEYLKSIHCPWDRITFELESNHVDIEIRQWLLSNGYEHNL